MLTDQDVIELTAWRRKLHQQPELSNEEHRTALEVVDFLQSTGPDRVFTGLGGHGVAVVFDSGRRGPTVLFRSELDALPIQELSGVPHSSLVAGKGHMCGHDGHSTILAGLARLFGKKRPYAGRVVLLFQPAEESGDGAAGVLQDPRFSEIAPDYAFSLHNLPGIPFGEVRVRTGTVNCASRGLRVKLFGKTAHSSMPETGSSPVEAMCELMRALPLLGRSTFDNDDFRMATVSHGIVGEPTYGVAPGYAEVWASVRTRLDVAMHDLCAAAEGLVQDAAAKHSLQYDIAYHEKFVASVNDEEAVGHIRRALDDEKIQHSEDSLPMRASEDFGLFGRSAKSAMLFLGAGETYPSLHNPDYDFPDELIPIGTRIFARIAGNLLI